MSAFSTPVASPLRSEHGIEASSTAAPPAPGRSRRVLGWVLVAGLLIGIGLLSMRFLVVSPDLSGSLNPSNPGPSGAKALAELVRDQGVDVEVTRSRLAAADSVDADTTLVLTDPFTLTDDAAETLIDSADHVVLLTSSSRMLRLLELGEDAPGESGTVRAECDIPEFARIGQIEAERMFSPAPGVEGCFQEKTGASAVLRSTTDGRTITLVEAGHLLSNDALTQDGNAALGLALLAQQDRIVWYLPAFSDSDISSDDVSLGDHTPDWVSPAIVLLLLAGIAAVVWRGRRFGPLVAESLPVTVRAAETMQGRARLTAKAADAPHAGAVIRTGTLTRLAGRLALGPRASVPEIADAASDRLRVPRGSLYDLLGGAPPHTDQELIDLARSLAELETAVDDAVRTERNRP